MVTIPAFDVEACEALAARAAEGDTDARRHLIERLWPTWIELVRTNRSMRPLAASGDHVENVVGLLIEKFARSEGRGLRQFVAWRAAHAEKTIEDWIRIVTKNAIRDYLRKHVGSPKPQGEHEPSVKRLLNDFASSVGLEDIGVRPPYTDAQAARELLEFAGARLPADRLAALKLWLEGAGFDEIGRDRGISVAEARDLVRASVAILRRYFGGKANSA